MSGAKLSVVVLTKDAEDSIKDCLESIKWADEIIVVDDMSTDRTVEICLQYKAKVVSRRLDGNFSRQRNLGIDNANGEWILQLDADEVVTLALKNEIQRVLNIPTDCVGYKYRRKNYFLGHPMRYGGWYHYSLNLFKKESGRYEGLVHERLKLDGKEGMIEAEVEHRPFKSIAQFIERQNRYTDYEAQDILTEKGLVDKRTIFINLYVKPSKLFWKFYVKKQGFREGVIGFAFSVLYSFIHFLKWAKYWELTYGKGTT